MPFGVCEVDRRRHCIDRKRDLTAVAQRRIVGPRGRCAYCNGALIHLHLVRGRLCHVDFGRRDSEAVGLLAERDNGAVIPREPDSYSDAIAARRVFDDRRDLPGPGIEHVRLPSSFQAELQVHRFPGRWLKQGSRLVRRTRNALVVEEVIIGPGRFIPAANAKDRRRRARFCQWTNAQRPQLARYIRLMRHLRN